AATRPLVVIEGRGKVISSVKVNEQFRSMVSVVLMQQEAIFGHMFRSSRLVLCSAVLVCAGTFTVIAETASCSKLPSDAVSATPDAGPVSCSQLAGETVTFLKQKEGFRPNAYGDFKQISIGYGTKALPGEKSISPQDAEARLRQEAAKVDAWINQNVKLPLTQGQRTALTDFGYNLGTGKGGLSDLLPNIEAGNWQGIAKQMSAYIHSGGHINAGLIKRRDAEMALLFRSDGQQVAANSVKRITTPQAGPVRGLSRLFNTRLLQAPSSRSE